MNDKYWSYEIWDMQSEVNRVSAEVIKEEHKIREEDEVYLIKHGNVATMIQSSFNTPFPADTIEESAKLHLESILEGFQRSEAEQAELSEMKIELDELRATVKALKAEIE